MKSDNLKFSKALIGIYLLLINFSYGCASAFWFGATQEIFIDTPLVKGASCRLTGGGGSRYLLAATPGNMTVKKSDGPMAVVCEKEDYERGVLIVQERSEYFPHANRIAKTGPRRYPSTIVVWMKPNKFASKAEEEKWHATKKSYDDAIIKKENERIERAIKPPAE